MEIEYRQADVNDMEQIIVFLRKHFLKDEPLNLSLKVNNLDNFPSESTKQLITSGSTYVAIAKTTSEPEGMLAGVLIGGPDNHSSKPNQLSPLFEVLARQCRFSKRYNVPSDKIFHGKILAVDRDLRGQSIGIELYRQSLELAKRLGYKLYASDCTSFYSARLCEKLTMDLVNVLPYNEYCDADGQQVFYPPSPHKHIKSFAKLL